MATVVLGNELSRLYAGGEPRVEVDAHDYRSLVKALDAKYPGIAEAVKSGVAVAIDGEIYQDPLLEPVQPDSEVFFLPAIEGG